VLNLGGGGTSEKFYCEQVVNGARNRRGNYSEVKGKLSVDFDLFGTPMMVDAYHSVFVFDSEFKDHMDNTKSVRGFAGRVYSNMFHWDMDDPDSLEGALKDTRELVERLHDIGISNDSLRLYFSGNKGFHLFLLSDDLEDVTGNANTNGYIKYVCSDLAKGLSSFDDSVYDKTRIIRCANSLHGKSDKYKIPLDISELFTLNSGDIYKLASKQREIEWFDEYCSSDYIIECLGEYSVEEAESGGRRKPKLDGSTLVQGIYDGFEDGGRNTGLTSLAGLLHSRNITDSVVRAICSSVNNQSTKPLKESALDTIVESVSKYKINDDFVPPEKSEILTMKEAAKRWRFSKRNRQKIETGFGALDKELYTFDNGKVLMIAARSGIGKTSLGMQLANNLADNLGGEALFASLEMSSSAIFYRAAQINTGGDTRDAEKFTNYLLDDEEYCEEVSESWNSLRIIDKEGLSLDKIEAYFNMLQEENNGNTKCLIVDYLGLVANATDYHGVSEVARGLKNIAKRLNTRVIMLVQLSRGAGDGTIEPKLNHMRDSGSIEEAADIILGMWRSTADNYRIHCKMLKNRDGILGVTFDLMQDGLNYKSAEFDDSKDTVADVGGGGGTRRF